jgi:hypothetical protein
LSPAAHPAQLGLLRQSKEVKAKVTGTEVGGMIPFKRLGCNDQTGSLPGSHIMTRRFALLLTPALAFVLAAMSLLAQGNPVPADSPDREGTRQSAPKGPIEDPNAPQPQPNAPIPPQKIPVPDPNTPIQDPNSPGMPNLPATPPPAARN